MDMVSGTLPGVDWAALQTELRRRMDDLPRGRKTELAQHLGVTPMYVSHIIRGRRPLTAERAELVAAFLGVQLDMQLTETVSPDASSAPA